MSLGCLQQILDTLSDALYMEMDNLHGRITGDPLSLLVKCRVIDGRVLLGCGGGCVEVGGARGCGHNTLGAGDGRFGVGSGGVGYPGGGSGGGRRRHKGQRA